MGRSQTFTEFLTSQSVQIPVVNFIINLVIVAILAYILNRVYKKFGSSLSNRSMFGSNFVLLSMTTMLIISIVKSSLALSLGLVGALSIVRFRAAIKEPEELVFLFIAIAIGLGMGADQRITTVIAFAMIIAVIIVRYTFRKTADPQNLHLTIATDSKKIELSQVVDTLGKYCPSVNLKRFDETKDALEASFLVEFDNINQLQQAKSDLQKIDDSIKVTFLDSKAIM